MQIPDTEVKPNSKLSKASLNKLEEFKNKANKEKQKTKRVKMKTEKLSNSEEFLDMLQWVVGKNVGAFANMDLSISHLFSK